MLLLPTNLSVQDLNFYNYIASNYQFKKNSDYLFFCSSDCFSETWRKKININSDLYKDFLHANTCDQIILFLNKYGSIICPFSSPLKKYSYLHDFSPCRALSRQLDATEYVEPNYIKRNGHTAIIYEEKTDYDKLHSSATPNSSNPISIINKDDDGLIFSFNGNLFDPVPKSPFRLQSYMENTDFTEKSHDYIILEHFYYYHMQLRYIDNIQSALKTVESLPKRIDLLSDAFCDSVRLLTNPFFSDMALLEYPRILNNDLLREAYANYFTFSLMYTINQCFITSGKSPKLEYPDVPFGKKCYQKRLFLFKQLLKVDLSTYNKQIDTILKLCLNELQRNASPNARWSLSHSFICNHKTSLLNYLRFFRREFFEFELKDISLYSSFENADKNTTLHFPNLISIIFYKYQLDASDSYRIKECAYTNCKKLFACSLKSNTLYCSPECGHNAANWNYYHRKVDQKKS